MSAATGVGSGGGPRVAAGRTRAGVGARAARAAGEYLPAIMVGVVALVLWEAAYGTFASRLYVVPSPSSIASAMVTYWSDTRFPISRAAFTTLTEAIGGFVVGTTAGVLVAIIATRWAALRSILFALAVAAGAIPIIAFSPLFNTWFGLLNPLSKILMAAVLSFFPVMANVSRGLSSVEPASLELMRSYAASEGTILRKVRIPNALPFLFTALKLASTLSLIGAIVAEYSGGQTAVLGQLIITSISALKLDVTWACIVLAAAAGVAFYLLIVVVERIAIPWHGSRLEG